MTLVFCCMIYNNCCTTVHMTFNGHIPCCNKDFSHLVPDDFAKHVSLRDTFLSHLSFWYETPRAGSPIRSRMCSCSGETGEIWHDYINSTLSHKTATTIAIKLSRQTLTKPVNAELQTRQNGCSKPSGQVTTGDNRCVCVCVCYWDLKVIVQVYDLTY